jgi:hypothetical protein
MAPLPPESRDLAALDSVRRMLLRSILKLGIALAVVVALGFWCSPSTGVGKPGDFAGLRSNCTALLVIAGEIILISLLVVGISHGRIVRKIAETRSVQTAMAAHHDLPPTVIARMAAKAWHWRALCLSGAVMIVSFSAMAALVYFRPSGYLPAQVIADLALPVIILWSMVRFGLAAVRFVRFSRETAPSPPPGPNP